MPQVMRALLSLAVLLATGQAAPADTVTIAVAANFLPVAERMNETFSEETGHDLRIVHGSSGRLYAQIVAGAPYDVFLSADAERPADLAAQGLTRATATYAIGRLALVGPPGWPQQDVSGALDGQVLAVPDPELAPYGRAALEALDAMGVATGDTKLVIGESVGQTALFVATGNAPFGVIAVSLLEGVEQRRDVDVMLLDPSLHGPIRQDAALMRRAEGEGVQAFWDWLFSPEAEALLAEAGYDVPD